MTEPENCISVRINVHLCWTTADIIKHGLYSEGQAHVVHTPTMSILQSGAVGRIEVSTGGHIIFTLYILCRFLERHCGAIRRHVEMLQTIASQLITTTALRLYGRSWASGGAR